MLESFAAWILNTYIGDYFGNVNTHQLRMSLKNGEIELESLPLKRDLIKYLGLPLEAKTGFIGKISIKFPSWHSFTSEPLVISIEDLFLIVKPITNFTYNEEEENRQQQEFKLSQLDMMEQRWKAIHDEDLNPESSSSYYSSSYSSWLNYGSSFINNVLMNIHLKISSIHIRYEDYSTIPGCPFATGVIIRSLTICSTDEHWQPKFVTRSAGSSNGANGQSNDNFLFKLIDLESFSCYCDTETTLFGDSNFDKIIHGMRQTLDKNLNRKGALVEHGYMIAPVNGKCYLRRNCSEMSLKSCRQPRTVIDVQLERVPIMMTAIQYKHLLDWSLAFQTQKTLWRYRKWRPMIHNHRNKKSNRKNDDDEEEEEMENQNTQDNNDIFDAKTWWHFAVNANLEDYRQRRQRFNWHFILQRARDVVQYHRAYLHFLLQPESLTKEMRLHKDKIENEFSLDELCSIREMIFWRADQILKKHLNNQYYYQEENSSSDLPSPDIEANETEQQQSSYWFLPFNVLSNIFYNSSQQSSTPITPLDSPASQPLEFTETSNKRSHRRTQSTSSINTEDIFLMRDAVYCQFNFQIHNSSFQLIAFNDTAMTGIVTSEQTVDQTFISASTSFFGNQNREREQGNLLLEFEFNEMKIGVDVTNPNAYACSCHQRNSSTTTTGNDNNLQLVRHDYFNHINQTTQKMFLTQNELNQLQLDLNFECQNLNLTLLRTDNSAIISDVDMQKLATAQLTGCGIQFRFSTDLIQIDGKMESLELLDLITAPNVNKHKRVLSIGKNLNNQFDQQEMMANDPSDQQQPIEKALRFSLSRQMNENLLRVNIEMASFCYVHSGLFMYELALCRKCFSDVLEAYFSRAFKERVKAATTEVLRGIVPNTTAPDSADDSGCSITTSVFNEGSETTSPIHLQPQSAPIIGKPSKLSLFSGTSKNTGKHSRRKAKSSFNSSSNPFIDNFRLNVFIRSPVIICPISPSSHEVVVFHLGHMLLNNHNHSSEIVNTTTTTMNSLSGAIVPWKPTTRTRKFGTIYPNGSAFPTGLNGQSMTTSTTTTSPNISYNAEIRDLSVYSLDCSKNIKKFSYQSQPESQVDGVDCLHEPEFHIPVEKLYFCDMFGVPILQKTIIEINLERKTLFSSMFSSTEVSKKTSKSPTDVQSSTQSQSTGPAINIVDGLNLISSVNSIDPLVLPKKFSIRQHIYPDLPPIAPSSGDKKTSKNSNSNKPEMVLSIEISAIEVRFSYTDLLVCWHILNTLTAAPEATIPVQSSDDPASLDITTTSANVARQQQIDQENEEMLELLQQITLSSSGLDAEEFRSRLNNLIDLGFNPRESLRALSLKNGDIIEAAYMLSSNQSKDTNNSSTKRQSPDQLSEQAATTSASQNPSDDNHSQCSTTVSTNDGNNRKRNHRNDRQLRKHGQRSQSNFLLSLLSVIEVKILNGSIRIIDDCNQLDLPLLELGMSDFRLMQYYRTPTVEAHAQTNFYCDYYNSHLSGWEPFIEHCQLAFSWKLHEPRCHLKSMLNTAAIVTTNRIPVARQKLAIKIDMRKMFNLNVSRTLLDLIEKVNHSWKEDIENFMSLPVERRAFRHRQPFIPFALKNETGTDLQMFLAGQQQQRKMFATGKAPDLITPCDLKSILSVQADRVVYFDCVDSVASNLTQKNDFKHRSYANRVSTQPKSSSASTSTVSPLKIFVKVDGWQQTFPLSIEREGTFIRHIVSERYTNQSAILVFDISLQPSAIKLITVRSSLLIINKTTKTVELKFVNTAMSDVRTSYMISPNGGVFPVPLDLLYARIQLRPCDLGIGVCSTYINWNHVRRFGELDCSLQVCTPITHTQHGSYSKSQAYVVSVLVERNSIGALIESRNIFRSGEQKLPMSPLVTLPSHTITLLPPLQLANRLPYELRFKILSSSAVPKSGSTTSLNSMSSSWAGVNQNSHNTTGTIKSGDDYSVHYISPLEPFSIEFQMEHYPRCRPLHIEPGAIKNYQTHIDMYDAQNRLLVLNAHVTVQAGSPSPSNAMTITIYAPYWIVNRSGLPLVFAQEGGTNAVEEAAGQYEEHERARSISPLLFSFSDPESPQYCIMRLGRMLPQMAPRWCNLFCLEKGTFYRRLRVTDYSPDPTSSLPAQEKIYEFGIDIRQGRDRYHQTKIVTIAPRFQIENLTSFKLEFAQKCFVEADKLSSGFQNSSFDSNGFVPSYMSSPVKQNLNRSGSFSRHPKLEPEKLQIISALPKSNMPFHWPATDRPKLLCVRIASLIGCQWSGSFDVGAEPSVSFHLNIRDDSGRSNFIRVEILLQNATYFIVFTDANQLPPPIRIENFSQVAIEFYQVGSSHRTLVRPNSSVPYALDEPTQPGHLTVCAPGGSHSIYDLNSFAPGDSLTYDNFYYLAFEETFSSTMGTGLFGPGLTGNYYFNHNQIMMMDQQLYNPYYYDDDAEQWWMMMMMGGNDDLSFMENDIGSKMLVLDVPDVESQCDSPIFGEKAITTETILQPKPKPVVLGRKERGKRSQLWRFNTQTNHLIHEGSSPPLEPGIQDIGYAEVKFGGSQKRRSPASLMVLDVMDDELVVNQQQQLTYLPLAVRKLNPARSSTQTWQFTEDGRLRCLKYWNMFVQPLVIYDEHGQRSPDGQVFQNGTMAVIALGPQESTVTKSTIPKEQAILKQKMRKGSGHLNVSIMADGPSRVLRIKDNQLTANGRQLNLVHFNHPHNNGNGDGQNQFGNQLVNELLMSHQNESFLMRMLNKTELELNLQVHSVGVSVVSKLNEEIIFLYMRKIILEFLCNPAECRLNCVVEDFQVDNQLLGCEKEVVLYVTNLESNESQQQLERTMAVNHLQNNPYNRNSSNHERPAITFNMHKLFIPNVEINVFKSLQISINDLVLNIEELVLLKLLEFINYDPVDSEMDEISSTSGSTSSAANGSNSLLYHASGSVVSSSLSRSIQYFFAYLLVQLQRVKLSVFTSSTSLGKYLTELKKKAGIKLIRFEEAMIQLRPFHKVYSLMTRRFLQDSIHEHYRSELRSQAAKILGTVDFLGNPVGFINNVVEGISEFYYDRSFRGLFMNVTHGISDSTAKVTSVLSESLGFVTMDDRHQEIRRKIKQQTGGIGGQRSHLAIGAFGLAHGIIGGITSVISQTYDGIVNQGGMTGFITGLTKGVLGTFTKPAVGMLDFASGAATAVRDRSRKACFGMNGRQVRRVRLPRTLTIDGRLTRYQSQQSQWQSRFYNTTDFGSQREYGEQFVHVFLLSDRHFVLVTTERLYFFHAPIKKSHLPLEDVEDNIDNYDEDDRFQQHDLMLTSCPIQQLQILSLEHFRECNHHRMMLHEGQYFLKTHSTCSDLTTMIGTPFHDQSNHTVCHFIEFRQSITNRLSQTSPIQQPTLLSSVQHGSNGQPETSLRDQLISVRTSRDSSPSSQRKHQKKIKASFEYPRHLSPCYFYCDCPKQIQKIIQLINEAKHLQEERKFEVSNLDFS